MIKKEVITPVLVADKWKVIQNKKDLFQYGKEIHLGVDYSTGKARQDKAEYYIEIDEIIEDLSEVE